MTKCPKCNLRIGLRTCSLTSTTICSVCCKTHQAFEICNNCMHFSKNETTNQPAQEALSIQQPVGNPISNSPPKFPEPDQQKCSFLTITGAPKTASCSLVGLLNSHPEIFIFMEINLNSSLISHYAKMFLNKFPDARSIFRNIDTLETKYSEIHTYLKNKGYNYKYLGDKIVDLDTSFYHHLDNHKVIFTVRDIRTWIIKNSIRILYYTEQDLVPAAIDYCIYFLKSFLLPNVMHHRMNDMLHDNNKAIENLNGFLEMDLYPHVENWWDKVIIKDPENPKSCMPWWNAHPRSATKPEGEDTVVQLGSHSFWDHLLPIFDKYYNNTDYKFDPKEVNHDIKNLKTLMRFSPLPLNAIYSDLKEDPNYSL